MSFCRGLTPPHHSSNKWPEDDAYECSMSELGQNPPIKHVRVGDSIHQKQPSWHQRAARCDILELHVLIADQFRDA